MKEIMEIGEQIKACVNDFKPHEPILMSLRAEGMMDRHWDELATLTGEDIRPSEGFTFAKVMEMKLLDNTDGICDIGEKARREYGIETMLAKMKSEWEGIELGLKPFK